MENEEYDLAAIVQSIRGHQVPFKCPACLKNYRSLTGIMYHLGQIGPPTRVPRCRNKGGEGVSPRGTPGSPGIVRRRARRDLTWAESQRMVEVEFNNEYYRIEIDHDLDTVHLSEEEGDEEAAKEPAETPAEDPLDPSAPTPATTPSSTSLRTPQRRTKCETKATSTPKSGKSAPSKNKGKRRSSKKAPSSTDHASSDPAHHSSSSIARLVADFTILDSSFDYSDAPARDPAYYRFVEQTSEDLDEMVEYDMDEEDYQWLSLVNEDRKSQGLTSVPQDAFEVLMDRLEKECFFEVRTVGENGEAGNPYNIDENAVCCICNDGECHNTNAILFCDMCNLAVHQECYGVPYIPEGQWLCRRCLQSPSRAVDCLLCPNKGGAFKQTVEGQWAHVSCALWIPEVQFANTVFLEPIDGIREIPQARWKLTCYVCRRRGGACIQCAKANCYVAFHVTCAQQAGLHMKIEAPARGGAEIKKLAYCDAHTPVSVKKKMMMVAAARGKGAETVGGGGGGGGGEEVEEEEEGKEKVVVEEGDMSVDHKRKEEEEEEGSDDDEKDGEEGKEKDEDSRGARRGGDNDGSLEDSDADAGDASQEEEEEEGGGARLGQGSGSKGTMRMSLEDRRSSMMQPVVNIPYVPQHRLDRIIGRVSLHKKSQFIPKLVNYWKLKRQSRNGVPLLRRLQASNNRSHRATTTNMAEEREVLMEQLEVWRTLRRDLERVRLLMELIRKRERLKQEQMKMCQHVMDLQLCPLDVVLKRVLDRLMRKDPANIFAQPVSVEDVPDYLQVIKVPMDFGTMRTKVSSHEYLTLDDFEQDFNQVWRNATIYNEKETIYYRAATRIRDAGEKILAEARDMLRRAGVSEGTGVHVPEVLEPEPLPSSASNATATAVTMEDLDLQDVFDGNDEEGVAKEVDHALPRARLESTTLEEQVQILEERLSLLRSQPGGRKAKKKMLIKELNTLKRRMRAQHKSNNPPNSESDTCPSPPPRRPPPPHLGSRNAEGLASQMLQGSLRLTPSRHQILCCSGISLEERAAASALSTMMMMQNGLAALERSGECPQPHHHPPPPPPPSQPHPPPPPPPPPHSQHISLSPPPQTLLAEQPTKVTLERAGKSVVGVASLPTPVPPTPPPPPTPPEEEEVGGDGYDSEQQERQKGRTRGGDPQAIQDLRHHHHHHHRHTPPRRNRSHVTASRAKPQATPSSTVATPPTTVTPTKKADESGTRPRPSLRKRPASSSSVYETATDDVASSEGMASPSSPDAALVVVGGAGATPFSSSSSTHHLPRFVPRVRVTSSSDAPIPSASSSEDLTVRVPLMLPGVTSGGVGNRKRRTCSSDGEERHRKRKKGRGEVADRVPPPPLPPATPNRTANGVVLVPNGEYQIKPLDLVWAKCRGYPPYPALVIDPDSLPEKGLDINGESIQPPSEEVLELREKIPGEVFLVRFFDGRRSWQWLPADKIEPLGTDGQHDQHKIASSGASKRSVQQAYVRAKEYQGKLDGVVAGREVDPSNRET